MDLKDTGTLIELKIGSDSHYIQILPGETVKEFSVRLEESLSVKMDIGDMDEDTDVLNYFTSTNRETEASTSTSTSSAEVGTVIEGHLFCCVPGCSSNTLYNPDLAIFKFPSQKKRCWEWLDAINRNDLQKEPLKFLSTRLGVCRDHFAADQFMKDNTVLKYSAIPSLPAIKQDAEQDQMEVAEMPANEDESHPGALCRLCATRLDAEPLFIFENSSTDGKTIADLINTSLPIEVSQVDPLPKQICNLCFERVKIQNAFAEVCVEAEKKLIAMTKRFHSTDEMSNKNKQKFCCPLCCIGGMSHTKNDLFDTPTADGGHILAEVDDGLYSDDGESGCEEVEIKAESPMNSVYLSEDQIFQYECEICEEAFSSSHQCLEHCLAHGAHEYFPCTPCGLVFTSEELLKEHFSLHKMRVSNAKKVSWKTVYLCRTCNYQAATKKNFILHKCSNPVLDQRNFEVAKDLQCQTCDRTFLSETRATKHMAKHDGTMVLKLMCNECNMALLTPKMLAHHMAIEHNGIEHRCDECDFRFISQHHLDRHKRVHTKIQSTENHYQYQCSVCSRKFATLNAVNKHLELHNVQNSTTEVNEMDKIVYKCSKCPQKFNHRPHLQHHLETSHDTMGRMPSLIQYQCNICSERITTSNEVLVHRTSHWKSRDPMLPHVCEYCGEAHPSPNALARHRRYLHPDEHPYICTLCETTTRTLYEARVHRKTHTGYSVTQPKPQAKIYQCENCPSLFTDRESFIAHKKNHKTAKWHQCDQCDKTFPERHRLMVHQRQHTGEKPYMCGTCGKTFAQTSAMYTHALLHTGETPHPCDLCNRKFRIKSDRDSHRRTHTGEKPYTCPFCYKSFRTGQVYYQHRMIHTGERRFRCDLCGQAFKRSHTLVVHRRIHTGEKPNVCDVCGKGFRQRTDMRKHRMHLHGVTN